MSWILFILLNVLSSAYAEEAAALPGGQCLICHQSMEDEPSTRWKDDVHATAGIGCNECHGGDPTSDDQDISMDPKKGFKGAPKRADIPKLCAKCHSNPVFMKKYNPMLRVDQYELYLTSQHGKKLKQGDTKVAECVSCHSVHNIRKVNDAKSPVYAVNLPTMCAHCHADPEYMKPYKISTTVYAEYAKSVHGKALLEKGDVRGAPACNDCHGNHGATPPGLKSIAHICGSCHVHNAELFLKSPMAKALQKDPYGECISCHGNHLIVHISDDRIGTQQGAICAKCHKEGDKGAAVAMAFSKMIGSLKNYSAEASKIIEEARDKGMDVTEAEDSMQNARQALIQARTEIHSFSMPGVEAKITEGRKAVDQAIALGKAALRENKTRRVGLGISTIFLTLLVIALALKIRSLPPPRK
ncbi:MAG TPA: cytochrome c3 family protein [Bdellovibrionota bacterium]|nr:cytochrome c3 family protein [Bdellovibrionota bacterium]